MPVLKIYGIPTNTSPKKLENFHGVLAHSVFSMPELALNPKDVSCFFIPDMRFRGPEGEIVIFVEGLFEAPARTEKARTKLAKKLVSETHKLFPESGLVECLVRIFDPRQGFDYYVQA